MADGFAAKDATGATVEILTDEVTDAVLGTGQKQIVGVMDATPNSTNKLIVDSSGRAKVDASGVAVPVTDNSGSLTVDDGGGSITVDGTVIVSSGPAASRTTDSIAAALATDSIMNGLTALPPKFIPISASASGATTVVAAVTGKKIRLLGFFLVTSAASSIAFRSGTTITQKTGDMPFAANGGISVPFSPAGYFETVAGEALQINLSATASVGGMAVYIEV